MKTLYESDHCLVRYHPGSDQGRFIVVSFTGIGAPERHDGSFFGAALATRLDLPWVGIVARHDDWYREGDYGTVFEVVRRWIAARMRDLASPDPIRVVGYGISMGAYATIKYSRALSLDYVVAVAPQWSLDKEEAPYFSHFKHLFRPPMKAMGIRENDVSGNIYVLFDPYEAPDKDEVEMLRRHVRANAVPVCYGGHMLLGSLKGRDFFLGVLENLDDPAAFRRNISDRRRKNSENIARLVERALRHRPALAALALSSRRVSDAVSHPSDGSDKRLWRIAATLARSVYARQADYFFFNVTGRRSTCFYFPRIMSWVGELLCYSHATDEFSQTERHLPGVGSVVTVVDGNLFAVTPAGLMPVPGDLEVLGNLIALKRGPLYLSARDGGGIALMPHRREWEEFVILPPRLITSR